jgi:hypothetical protein
MRRNIIPGGKLKKREKIMFIEKYILYLSERSAENRIGFHIEGELSEEDIELYQNVIEGAIAQFGEVRLLFAFDNLSEIDLDRVWEDLRFSLRYVGDIERIALVGEQRLKNWMEEVIKPNGTVQVKHFGSYSYDRAWNWLNE